MQNKLVSLKLNDKQRDLAAENEPLIRWFMNKKRLREDDIADFYGICAIGLCKAAAVYDPRQGNTFSTLASVCMLREVMKYFQHLKTEVDYLTVLDGPADNSGDTEDLRLIDIIADPNPSQYTEDMEFWDELTVYLRAFTPKEQEIISLNILGKSPSEMGPFLSRKVAHQRIHQILIKFYTRMGRNQRFMKDRLHKYRCPGNSHVDWLKEINGLTPSKPFSYNQSFIQQFSL